jgi:hypothetical protein
MLYLLLDLMKTKKNQIIKHLFQKYLKKIKLKMMIDEFLYSKIFLQEKMI